MNERTPSDNKHDKRFCSFPSRSASESEHNDGLCMYTAERQSAEGKKNGAVTARTEYIMAMIGSINLIMRMV